MADACVCGSRRRGALAHPHFFSGVPPLRECARTGTGGAHRICPEVWRSNRRSSISTWTVSDRDRTRSGSPRLTPHGSDSAWRNRSAESHGAFSRHVRTRGEVE
jgi:hypothetical protein